VGRIFNNQNYKKQRILRVFIKVLIKMKNLSVKKINIKLIQLF
jgi:hypothetical protein